MVSGAVIGMSDRPASSRGVVGPLRLCSEDADAGTQFGAASAIPESSPRRHRRDDRIEVGHLLQQFQRGGALPRDHVGVS